MSKNMEKENCNGCGSSGAVDITGCRMSLYPMCDRFVDVILSSIQTLDTSKVWSQTDLFSTIYRGKQSHVLNCAQAAFIGAYRPDVHMACELTLSKGCPGDVDADRFLAEDDTLQNQIDPQKADFTTYSKISFYTFGTNDYMEHIMQVKRICEEHGLQPQAAHYVTMLQGSANDTFACIDAILTYAYQHLSHYVLEATLSVNSPSLKKN